MQITELSRACVRVEDRGRTLAIDPGSWSESEALVGPCGAHHHEHADHPDGAHPAGLELSVFAPATAAINGLDLHRWATGERFTAASLPGDALHVPDWSIETLLVPVHGPWLNSPRRSTSQGRRTRAAVRIHDGQLKQRGLASINNWLTREASDYRYPTAEDIVDETPWRPNGRMACRTLS